MRIGDKLSHIKSPADLFVLLRIITLASILPFLVRWVRFPDLVRFLGSRRVQDKQDNRRSEQAIKFTNFVLSRNILMFRRNCLKRSLLLYRFLRQAGMDVDLNIGIRKESGELTGHSWLTYEGNPHIDSGECTSGFHVIYSSRDRVK